MSKAYDKAAIADRIREGIKRKGMTVSEFARESGINRVTLYTYLNERSIMNISMAFRIAAALGMSVDQLIFGEGRETHGQNAAG